MIESSKPLAGSGATRAVRTCCVIVIGAALCFGIVSLVSLILAARSDSFDVLAKCVLTTVAGMIIPCLVVIVVSAIERREKVALMWFTLALLGVTFPAWMIYLWTNLFESSRMLQAVCSMSIAVVAITIVGQLLIAPSTSFIFNAMRVALIPLVALFAGWLIVLIWTTWWQRHEDLIALVTTAVGLLLLLNLVVLWQVFRYLRTARRHARESLPDALTLRFKCPRCGADQTLKPGTRACGGCHTVLLIEIQEPRCECGYLLYQLHGNTCPECGRIVNARPGSGVNKNDTAAVTASHAPAPHA